MTRLLSIATLMAALAGPCGFLAARGVSVVPARLSMAQLGKMLDDLGLNPKANTNKEGKVVDYDLEFQSGTWTMRHWVSISPSGKFLWINTNLAKPLPAEEVSVEALLGLLEQNNDVWPAFVYYVKEVRRLRLGMGIRNEDLTPAKLRKDIDTFTESAKTLMVRFEKESKRVAKHPLLDPEWRYRIELYSVQARPGEKVTTATTRKKKEFIQRVVEVPGTEGKKRTELLVAARDGETFEIHLANKSEAKVGMHLLIDGVNTLGGKRERLGEGRPWILAAKEEYVIPGFILPPKESGGKDVLRLFQFAGVARSVPGRQNFGLIAAAFYAEKTARRLPPGTGDRVALADGLDREESAGGRNLTVREGQEVKVNLATVEFRPGELLGVVRIRYVDERELAK
jgi:hypothetical protein